MANVKDYLIWPDHPGEIGEPTVDGHLITGCARVGGDYIISLDEADWIRSPRGVQLKDEDLNGLRARLTTMLVDQRRHGSPTPVITKELIQRALVKRPLPIYARAHRLLMLIAEETRTVGKGYDTRNDNLVAFAWSESITAEEIVYLTDHLLKQGLLRTPPNIATRQVGSYRIPAIVIVTVEGHSQIEQDETNSDSSQAFVAMWFDEEMIEAFREGIEPAIRDAGYEPLRIDQKEHVNKVDDEIIAEIRRSQFLVADFTQGSDGARGGVYYEAGFAHGLNLPVIFTCKDDAIGTLHFDTEHYNHIVWTTPANLRDKLKNRILAVLGEGPRIQTTR